VCCVQFRYIVVGKASGDCERGLQFLGPISKWHPLAVKHLPYCITSAADARSLDELGNKGRIFLWCIRWRTRILTLDKNVSQQNLLYQTVPIFADVVISPFSIVADYRLDEWSLIPEIYCDFPVKFLRPSQPPTLLMEDFYFDKAGEKNLSNHSLSPSVDLMHKCVPPLPTRIFLVLWSINYRYNLICYFDSR
jgi:hypothetical protein